MQYCRAVVRMYVVFYTTGRLHEALMLQTDGIRSKWYSCWNREHYYPVSVTN